MELDDASLNPCKDIKESLVTHEEPSVDLRLNAEATPVINPQLGNHVEKDATPRQRKENRNPTKIWANYATRKGRKVTIRGAQPNTITPQTTIVGNLCSKQVSHMFKPMTN